MSSLRLACLGFVFSVSSVAAANASLLTIVEGDNPGGGGFLNATFTQQGGTPAGVTFTGITTESLSFTITPPAALGPTNFAVSASVLGTLVEPGSLQISDQLTIIGLTGGPPPSVQFQFLSDSDPGSLGLCSSSCIEETGALQTLATVTFTTFVGGTSTILDTVTIQVQSDVEPRAVPEPGTLALLATALGLFGLGRRRKTT